MPLTEDVLCSGPGSVLPSFCHFIFTVTLPSGVKFRDASHDSKACAADSQPDGPAKLLEPQMMGMVGKRPQELGWADYWHPW